MRIRAPTKRRIAMLSRIFNRWRAELVTAPVACKDQRKARPLSYGPQIESLEDRMLLATDTWTGLGGNANWSNPANWSSGVAPSPGDDLIFDAPAARFASNDFATGTSFHSFRFGQINQQDFTIDGSAVLLTGGIQSAVGPGHAVHISLDQLTLAADQTFGGNLEFHRTVNQNGFKLTCTGTSSSLDVFLGTFNANGTVVGGAIIFSGQFSLVGPTTLFSTTGHFEVQSDFNLNGFDLTLDGTFTDPVPELNSG